MFEAFEEPAPGESRAYRYEVMTLSDGRWLVDCVMESAAEAKARARALLARGGCDEVKVLRHRLRRGGLSVSSAVLHQARPEPVRKPGRRLSGDAGTALGCQTLEDLSGWESRRFLSTLLRDYLTHHALLPSELLFDWRHGKRILDTDSLVNDALQRVARGQARRERVAPKEIAEALEKLLGQGIKRARDLSRARRALLDDGPLEVGGLPPLTEGAAQCGGYGAAALATACLGLELTGLDRHEAKLDRLLGLLPAAEEPWHGCIEMMLGECLLFPGPLRGLFPDEPAGAALIQRLIDLTEARALDGGDGCAPEVAALRYLIGRGAAPHCAAALEGWIAPLLSAKEPLDAAEPAHEGRLLELLGRRLRRADGRWIGGEAARRALESRRRQAREAALRGMGLESTADAQGRRR